MARKDKGGSAGASPSHSRRAHSQPHSSPGKSSHNNNGNSPNGNGSGRSKGVPQSFGYIKRQANGSGMASNMVTMDAQQHLMLNPQGQQQQQPQGNRSTAQVSAVPRGSKIKMSPGANQSTQDLHASKWSRVTDIRTVITEDSLSVATNVGVAQNRSFSLTGPGATQLSQSIRERLATSGSHSLPKPGTDLNAFQYR